MIIGFISDAHGNPFDLSACLERLHRAGAETIYFLGDAVGYWPLGRRVVEKLLDLDIPCLQGNHDAMAVGILPIQDAKEELYRLKPLADSLHPETRKMIVAEWPVRREIVDAGRRILLVHGRPSNPLEGYLYEDGRPLPREGRDFDIVVMGHTHRPFIRIDQGVIWLNAGSCGLPRDSGNLASCAVYDSISHEAHIFRVPMDTSSLLAACPPGSVADQVLDKIKADGIPDKEQDITNK